MTSRTRYPQELRERAVRMVLEHGGEYPSEWAAIESISAKLGMTRETLRRWVRRAQVDGGLRSGVTTLERERIRELEREVRVLRRANEMADSTGRRNDLREPLQWCQIAECFAWPVVEAVLDPESGLPFFRAGARPATTQVVKFIAMNKERWGVEPICRVLHFAPATSYAAASRKPSAGGPGRGAETACPAGLGGELPGLRGGQGVGSIAAPGVGSGPLHGGAADA